MKRDGEKARAFQQRGRGRLKRGRRRRVEAPEGPLSREEWERAVWERDGRRCTITGARVPVPRPVNFHHVVPKWLLRRDGKHEVVFDPDNGITVTEMTHVGHESAAVRIPREKLPERALAFAERHGYGAYIERIYPA